jgi:hypothetical protein
MRGSIDGFGLGQKLEIGSHFVCRIETAWSSVLHESSPIIHTQALQGALEPLGVMFPHRADRR